MKTYVYQHEDKVRDYECDLQGVVNNANYLHYMEHTRHEFLLSLGENFSDRNIHAMSSCFHSARTSVICTTGGWIYSSPGSKSNLNIPYEVETVIFLA